jgi:2-methylisocitrate lyase-like PEP mutase family enzyme
LNISTRTRADPTRQVWHDEPMAASPDAREAFARLHAEGCFVMPNPWDIGSTRVFEAVGFPAVATTSAGFNTLFGE